MAWRFSPQYFLAFRSENTGSRTVAAQLVAGLYPRNGGLADWPGSVVGFLVHATDQREVTILSLNKVIQPGFPSFTIKFGEAPGFCVEGLKVSTLLL